MIGEADYRNVTSAVRTPRVAAFIEESNPYWRTAVASLIRIFSHTWGGKYFLIVPTDGSRIKDKFWELLEAYSPDYLAMYSVTLADLEEAAPDQYEARVAQLRTAWRFSNGFDDWFKRHRYREKISEFAIEPDLQIQLKNRLAPFHHGENLIVWNKFVRGHGGDFPFTKVTDINPQAHQPVKYLVLPPTTDDLDVRALLLSQVGDLDQDILDAYGALGVPSTSLSDQYDVGELLELATKESRGPSRFRPKSDLAVDLEESAVGGANDEVVGHMPFQASMLHLAEYYRLDTHRVEEPVTVVVGDTADDFCLYYCLSRLHDGVYWIPQKWLEEGERRRINNKRLRRRGRPPLPYSGNARLVSTILWLIYQEARSRHGERQLDVRSVSLRGEDLQRSVSMMEKAQVVAAEDFLQRTTVRALADSSTTCVARVIEENNFMTQQDMVFINGNSVGRLATPKPKNFSLIDPAKHRWLTQVDIAEYAVPPLSFLGSKIAATHESRASIDGIVYLCPGFITVGGDIDANLTRPKLSLVEPHEILRQYFAEAGLEIQPSDKGNYVLDTIHRFGGLAEAAKFLAASSTRGIFDLFLRPRSDGHVDYLSDERKAFVNFDGVKSCVGDDASAIIDELIGKDILRRGLIFQCVRCRLVRWYDVASLTTKFVCGRCSQMQQFTRINWKTPEEPRWYYALAETVYQCHRHDSYLTIVALDHLRARSKISFQFLPEIDVTNFPSAGESQEIDIACMVDNLIVIGECKTEPLKPSHTDKYEALATKLGRRPDEIVFATSNRQVSGAFRLKLSGMRGASVLTGNDLLI